MALREVYLGGNDYVLGWHLQDRQLAPIAALTVQGWISLTKGGPPIHAALQKTLVQGPVVEDHQEYAAVVPAADMITHLTLYIDDVVWDRISGNGIDLSEPIVIRAARLAGE